MDKNQAKHLLMKPKSEEKLEKILDSIKKKPNPVVLTGTKLEKIVNKIIAYEYILNNYILDENSVEMLRQDVDGVWCSYTSAFGKEYAKVWFTSANPNLRKIFFSKGENQ